MDVITWDGKPISKPGVYRGVGIEAYHGADLCAGPSISSSGLRTIFADSPMAYWIYSPLNPSRIEEPEKEAFILGRAAHHLVLGEEAFSRYFVKRPETLNGKAWNGNRTDCIEWLEMMADAGLTVLTPGQVESIQGMAGVLPWQKGLEDSGLANTAMVRAGALQGLIEHTIIARDEETGVYLKSRPDVIPTDSLIFNDFKTTLDVSDDKIRRTLEDRRYDMQADLASTCLEQAAGTRFEAFGFTFAAKKPPHATNVIELDPDDLQEAAQDNRVAVRLFARCLETGRWPGPAGRRGDAVTIRRSEWSRLRASDHRARLEQELAAA
ncbi:PD-(D/E)XK nuclease-like domain-containing protein [Phenylobacterium koreense]|uniref:Putative exodeoxyribonuclease 8 PDDEXK-like domain-containing protein n=1 Tax=Phenylobacterium koreense TaxID=266125 RepID=A0ABV2EKY1_9CAUL